MYHRIFFIFIGLQLVRYSFTFSYGNNGFYSSLAIYGVTSWKRGFILPWLIFYSAVKIFLILALISNIMNYALNLHQLFLLLVLFSVISAWRHIQIQFILMGMPRPTLVSLSITKKNKCKPTLSNSSSKDWLIHFQNLHDGQNILFLKYDWNDKKVLHEILNSSNICENYFAHLLVTYFNSVNYSR